MIKNKIVLSAMISALLLTAACSRESGKSPAAAPAANLGKLPVEEVKNSRIPDVIEASGTVRSRTTAIVSPRVPGVISLMSVREGSRVKKGELLARLDARENLSNAAAAGDAVEDASRALEEAKARKGFAEAQQSRYERLFKADAVSRQEYELKNTELEVAVQGVARAEARLRQARQQAKGADAFSDYTKIVAPITGIITSRHADLGATVFPGQPVFTIEDEGGYQLELSLPESMSLSVKSGSSVEISIDAVNSRLNVRVAEVVPSADPASRTFIAKIPLAVKGVKSGMYGRGWVTLGEAQDRITVPAAALQERGALTSVWVVDRERSARMRLVKSGKRFGDRIEILSGLTAGESVITGSIEKVVEGGKVELP